MEYRHAELKCCNKSHTVAGALQPRLTVRGAEGAWGVTAARRRATRRRRAAAAAAGFSSVMAQI